MCHLYLELESVYHIPLKGSGTLGISTRISSDLAVNLEKSELTEISNPQS